jgi:F-type H+-transporting ATPase subunit a
MTVQLTPDAVVLWRWGPLQVTATIAFTWLVITLLVAVSAIVARRVTATRELTRGQNLLEMVVEAIERQIHEISEDDPARYLPFVGTLFLFVATSNLLTIVPGYQPPTGSLSTATALALCVFVAVPVFGISRTGLRSYLRQYLRPSPLMLPFNIIGEVSRTLALAVRLFGNVMSGTLLVAVLISLAPLFFPIVMQAFGLLVGLIQAYIFAVLAMVYIASGARVQQERQRRATTAEEG